MISELRKHPLEYLLLSLVLVVGLTLFFVYSYDSHLQRRAIYLTAAGYFFWSLWHHYRQHDLAVSIIIEYLLFALLAIAIISATLI